MAKQKKSDKPFDPVPPPPGAQTLQEAESVPDIVSARVRLGGARAWATYNADCEEGPEFSKSWDF
jgi:hypothetical protein